MSVQTPDGARYPGARAALRAWPPEWVLLAIILAAAVALSLPAVQGLSFIVRNVEFYAHGYLVPAVAVYLVYQRRRELAAALRDPQPPPYGFAIAFLAGTFQLLMVVGDVLSGAGLGIPIVLGAAAYGAGGGRLLRPLLLPLAFLALMVPPPGFVLNDLLTHLKLFVTEVAVGILHAMGRPVLAEGNRIEVPGHTLFVADACSGLTSIVTMLPIACVIACFLVGGVWRRLVVVAAVVPLAMAANVIRVVATVELVSRIGIGAARGLLHESFGLATYVLGTLLLLATARLVR